MGLGTRRSNFGRRRGRAGRRAHSASRALGRRSSRLPGQSRRCPSRTGVDRASTKVIATAEKFRGARQAEPVLGVDGHHDIIVARQIAPPVWFRQITHPRPPAYTIAAIDRAAQRDKELIPIHEIDPRMRKSRVNDAACVAWPATHVQSPQALVNRKWNRCGDELQRGRLGGALLRVPQIEPCVEIFAGGRSPFVSCSM
jgi:hypothetical protein